MHRPGMPSGHSEGMWTETGVTSDVVVASGIGACRKRVGTQPGRGPVAMSDGVRGDRAWPVDVWAVAGGTVAWVHMRVRVDGGADSLLGGLADKRAVADGAVAAALMCSGAGEAMDEIGTVDGAVEVGACDVTHAGATGEACEAGATTALGRRGGRRVGRPGGSVPGSGGVRASGRQDQTEKEDWQERGRVPGGLPKRLTGLADSPKVGACGPRVGASRTAAKAGRADAVTCGAKTKGEGHGEARRDRWRGGWHTEEAGGRVGRGGRHQGRVGQHRRWGLFG